MSVAVEGYWPAHRETKRKARKCHVCDACREGIRVGDLYVVHWFVWEGSSHAVKRCLRCQAIYQHLLDRSEFHEAPDVRLNCGHDYREVWGDDPPPEVAALAFMTPDECQKRLAEREFESLAELEVLDA